MAGYHSWRPGVGIHIVGRPQSVNRLPRLHLVVGETCHGLKELRPVDCCFLGCIGELDQPNLSFVFKVRQGPVGRPVFLLQEPLLVGCRAPPWALPILPVCRIESPVFATFDPRREKSKRRDCHSKANDLERPLEACVSERVLPSARRIFLSSPDGAVPVFAEDAGESGCRYAYVRLERR